MSKSHVKSDMKGCIHRSAYTCRYRQEVLLHGSLCFPHEYVLPVHGLSCVSNSVHCFLTGKQHFEDTLTFLTSIYSCKHTWNGGETMRLQPVKI